MDTIWNFLQSEILGMQWLNRLTASLLKKVGVDTSSPIGGSLQFFIYDTIKILVLLGILIFIISFIQGYFPPERTRRILGRFRGLWANMAAALLGTVTPFCSCSSIPLFMGFTRAGLPLGVTFSFLISSPMVDLGSLVLLTGIFGWRVAVMYVLLDLMVAVVGGTIIGRLGMEHQLEPLSPCGCSCGCSCTQSSPTLLSRIRDARDQVDATFKKVAPYVFIGVAVGAAIHNWIPEAFVVRLLGIDNPFGVILAVLVGVPMYADIFGAIPIAEALLARGALLGVVLSFMMAVTTLSLPSLIMLRRTEKPKLLAVFIGACTLGIILVGYIFNVIHPLLL